MMSVNLFSYFLAAGLNFFGDAVNFDYFQGSGAYHAGQSKHKY